MHRRLLRWRLRTVIIGVAAIAGLVAWGQHARLMRLADDSDRFYTHEESVQYFAFQRAAVLMDVREAERRAAEGGSDREYWLDQARSLRAQADAIGRSVEDYRYRAELKRRLRPEGR